MARKRKTVKKNPLVPDDWPVREYPYLVRYVGRLEPQYLKSHTEVRNQLSEFVTNVRDQLRTFDHRILNTADLALQEIARVGPDGGVIDVEIDPHSHTRLRATITRRVAV